MATPEIKLDKTVSHLIEKVVQATEWVRIDFFLIGATARDLMLSQYGISPGRATRDVDLGIQVSTWEAFSLLKSELEKLDFKPTSVPHRMLWNQIPIDLVPFGKIEKPRGSIKWLKEEAVLSTLGFAEAYQTAHKFTVHKTSILRIASLSGLFLLKTIAWNDRPSERVADAVDLAKILLCYFDAGNVDRFYEEHSDLVDKLVPFDTQRAGAALLGRDLNAICQEESKNTLKTILFREIDHSSALGLLNQMPSFESHRQVTMRLLIRDLLTELAI